MSTVSISLRDLSRQIAQQRGIDLADAQELAAQAFAAGAVQTAAEDASTGDVQQALIAAGKLPSEARADAARLFGEAPTVAMSSRDLARQIAAERGLPLDHAQRLVEEMGSASDDAYVAPPAPTDTSDEGRFVPVADVVDAARTLARRTGIGIARAAEIVDAQLRRGSR